MNDYNKFPYARDASGHIYEYRRINSLIERRNIAYTSWSRITGDEMLTMTPTELRCIADMIEKYRK